MENKTLTAKEWLEKEELIWNYTAIPSIMLKKPEIETFMEQYANYRTKELENKIIEFREMLKDNMDVDEGGLVTIYNTWEDNLEIRDKFDQHFNIK